MTSIATHIATYEASERHAEFFDVEFPGWETREVDPEASRYVSEWDMPVAEIDADAVSDADWDAWFEMTYVDPAERVL